MFQRRSRAPIASTRLIAVLEPLDLQWEVLFVDDGSSDRTPEVIEKMHREDSRLKLAGLSRHFGHQAAVAAGLHYATGDVLSQ